MRTAVAGEAHPCLWSVAPGSASLGPNPALLVSVQLWASGLHSQSFRFFLVPHKAAVNVS